MKATRWKITTIVHTEVCEARLIVLRSDEEEARNAMMASQKKDDSIQSEITKALGSKWMGLTMALNMHEQNRIVINGYSRCGCPIHATDPVEPEHDTMFENNWILERTERDGDWVIGYWSEIDEAMEAMIKAEIEIRGKDVQSKKE